MERTTEPVSPVCNGAHRLFKAETVVTRRPSVLHIAVFCTVCGTSWHLQYPLEGEVAAIGSPDAKEF